MYKAINTAAQRACEVDIVHHHGQCEMNFHLCLGMLPGCRDGRDYWCYQLGSSSAKYVAFKLLDAAPYTSTIEIAQTGDEEPFINTPKILVRLYHDVEMAEVVAWDQHRHWLPVYSYPNAKMYQSDEKLVLNRFLGEWLVFLRKIGIYIEVSSMPAADVGAGGIDGSLGSTHTSGQLGVKREGAEIFLGKK